MRLRLDAVSKSFATQTGKLSVLKGVSSSFEQGKSYAITGASGTGKSTLLHILAGLTEPNEGAVYVDECNISLFGQAERERFLNRTMGLLFQVPYLIKELTVLENVMMKGLIIGQSAEACTQEALALLEIMGLQDKASERPPVLSGGQQQRVALARALFGKPAFLLADEPTGDLDPHTGKTIIDLLLQCQATWGMGIIVSTHDVYVAQSMQEIYELKGGVLKVKKHAQ